MVSENDSYDYIRVYCCLSNCMYFAHFKSKFTFICYLLHDLQTWFHIVLPIYE
jgi:hypothetical protein